MRHLLALELMLLASTTSLAAQASPEQQRLLAMPLTIQGRPEHPTIT